MPTPAGRDDPVAVELVTDARGGITVMRDGHPQSYVHLADPGLLAFEYVQHLALVVDALPEGRLRVTHVGGAGLTLARYVQHTRPGSPQIVLEPDEELTALVRREAPLPRRHRIRVRPVDGATGVAALADDSADVIVLDAFHRGQVPGHLTGTDFLGQAARVLSRGGVLLVNVSDEPGLRYAVRVAATVRTVLPQAALIGLTEVCKGRRFGNVVLVASDQPLPEQELTRRVAGCDFPTTLRHVAQTRRWSATATPFGAEGEASPPPPEPGRWRVR